MLDSAVRLRCVDLSGEIHLPSTKGAKGPSVCGPDLTDTGALAGPVTQHHGELSLLAYCALPPLRPSLLLVACAHTLHAHRIPPLPRRPRQCRQLNNIEHSSLPSFNTPFRQRPQCLPTKEKEGGTCPNPCHPQRPPQNKRPNPPSPRTPAFLDPRGNVP